MRATLLTKAFSLFERLASLSIHVQMAFIRVLKVINKAKQWNQAKPKFPGLLCFVFLFPPVWLRHEKIMAAQGLIILTGDRWGPKLYLVFNLRKIVRIEFKINFYLLDRYYVSFTGKIRPKYTWNKNILNSSYSVLVTLQSHRVFDVSPVRLGSNWFQTPLLKARLVNWRPQ